MSETKRLPYAVLSEEEIWAVSFGSLITEDPFWYEMSIRELVGRVMVKSKARLNPARVETRLRAILIDKGI